MKKKRILNICMVVTVIFVMLCGIMAVGSVKGWFDGENASETQYCVAEKTGIAMIERNGIAYEVNQDTVIRAEDRLYTKNGATLTLASAGKNAVYFNSNTEARINETKDSFDLTVVQGEILADARGLENLTVSLDAAVLTLDGATAAVSSQTGTTTISVYAGEITCQMADQKAATTIKAGNTGLILKNSSECMISRLAADSLNDGQLRQLLQCDMDETFCFTRAQLKQVQADREAEILEAQQEALAQKNEIKKEAASVKKSDKTIASTDNASDSAAQTVSEIEDSQNAEEDLWDEDIYEAEDSSEDTNSDTESGKMSCTIKIVCDTILDNLDNLETGKEAYVPSNGKILGTTTVEFSEGETVFDVLQRVCSSAGIQLEYSYTPIYESYYIEGINHLYEFDCGSESGWMYKVNGWFPNYGCSAYELEDGDTIVWCYTCNGLGADVGA